MFRSQRFYSYFLSYMLLVIILLVAVSSVVYQSFFQTLRKEVEQNTIATLTQFRDTVDQRLNEMDRIAMQIEANALLTPYAATEDGYGAYKAVSELKKYLASNLFLRDIVLYYNNSSRMYSADGTYDLDIFFTDIYKYLKWNRADFLKALPDMRAPVMRPMETVTLNKIYTGRYSTYLYPLPVHSGKPYGAILFMIEERAFGAIAKNVLKDYSGLLFVLNEKREIVYRFVKEETAQTADWAAEALRDTDKGRMIDSLERDGQEYTIVNLVSDKNGWSYVTVMPNGEFEGKVYKSRNIFNATVAIVFFLGVAMAAGFSLQHYKPLQRLASIVSRHHAAEVPSGRTDEIDFISQAVGHMAEEKEGMLRRMRGQAHAVKEQVLFSLVKGRIKTREELKDKLHFSDLRLDKPYYVVLLFLIDDYNKFEAEHSESMREILKYSLIKVFEELSEEVGGGFGGELIDGRGIVFLLNLDEDFHDKKISRELGDKGKSFFKQYFRQTVTVGIGGICSDMTKISQSYAEAYHAARYRFMWGGDRVIDYNQVESPQPKEDWFPVDIMDRLAKAIRQGDAIGVEVAVKESLRLIVEKNVSLESSESICFDVVNTILKTLIELGIDIDECMDGKLEPLSVTRFETIEELENLVILICRNVCRYVESKKESKNDKLLENIKQYVEEHYTDNAISLEQIAEHCCLSPSYATRFFKEQTGLPLMRYVEQLRMDLVKQMLKKTDFLLTEIMAKVGYIDSTSFIRKFKKLEGITPMEYRKMARGDYSRKAGQQ